MFFIEYFINKIKVIQVKLLYNKRANDSNQPLKGECRMNPKSYLMTQEGKEKIEAELHHLKEEKQKEIQDEIKKHHSFCDFSENSSFDQMLDEQALLKKKIHELEDMLAYAEVLPPKTDEETDIRLGDTVRLIELENGQEESYQIVGSKEADPFYNKISIDSPIGQGLLNKEVGEEVQIEIPDGKMKIKILEII